MVNLNRLCFKSAIVFFALVCLIGLVGIQSTNAHATSVLTINADGPLSGTAPAWVSKAAMQEPRSGLGVAAVKEKIYAIGGASATGFSSTNEEYDPAANTWTFKTPMPTSRSAFGIAVCENKIYCIGGYTVGGPTGVNEVYDPASDIWEKKAPMPTARLNLGANVVNDKIYLIGGIPSPDTGRTLNEVYDPSTDTWTSKASIPIGVDLYGSAVVGSQIFVMKSGLTQIYDVNSNSWRSGVAPPMSSLIASAVATTATNSSERIYLLGCNGEGPYWMLNLQGFTFQSYDPATDTWMICTSMPTGRISAGLVALNDKLYMIGGYNYGARSGLSLNAPIIFSAANEQYTPALDFVPIVEKTQATPSPDTPLLSPSATLTLSPTPSPSQSPFFSLSESPKSSASTSPSRELTETANPTQNKKLPEEAIVGAVLAVAIAAVVIVVRAVRKMRQPK